MWLNDDGTVSFTGGMSIDADGGRRTYAPSGSGLPALDYLENAGYPAKLDDNGNVIEPANWYGIVTDSRGKPVVAKSGYYISPTTYERKQYARTNPERYLDPEKEFFAVFPGPMRRMVKGVVLGCRVIVQDLKTGATKEGVAGDAGPASHLGEASIAYADYFGIPSSPKNGGVSGQRFKYIFFPGVAAEGYELQPM